MQFPIHIGLRRSFFLSLGIVGITVLAIISVVATPWALLPKASLSILIMVLGVQAWGRCKPIYVAMRVSSDSVLHARINENSEWLELSLGPQHIVHPWLIVLRLSSDTKLHSVPIFRDATDPAAFRHLAIWLRWHPKSLSE